MLAALVTLALLAGQPAERVVAIRVQGNTITPEAEIVAIAGVPVGSEFTPAMLTEVAARVRAGGTFERVEVFKRYASLSDPAQVMLVVIVDEGHIVVRRDGTTARAASRRLPPLMYLPILGSNEGYGFSYGALVTMQPVFGPGTRLSFPLTWGGERRAGVEVEKRFSTDRIMRLRGGATLLSRRNLALDATDNRQQVWTRLDREVVRSFRFGVWTGLDFVRLGAEEDRVSRAGVELTLDTRIDPMLSRNAVYVRSGIERLGVRGGEAPRRTFVDASTYIGLPKSSILVVRLYRDGADRAVPSYLKVLRGRDMTLRGFRAATAAGDTTAAGTIEIRVPLNSPTSVGKVGVRAFIDAATVYDAGRRMRDQRFDRGIGGGVWFTATVIRLALDVARGSAGDTRVQLSSGLLF